MRTLVWFRGKDLRLADHLPLLDAIRLAGRSFNPVTQGERFDPEGTYVRRWVPELAKVPARWVHSPWRAPPLELRACGVDMGRTYPVPIVDHALARGRFLAAAEAHLRRVKS